MFSVTIPKICNLILFNAIKDYFLDIEYFHLHFSFLLLLSCILHESPSSPSLSSFLLFLPNVLLRSSHSVSSAIFPFSFPFSFPLLKSSILHFQNTFFFILLLWPVVCTLCAWLTTSCLGLDCRCPNHFCVYIPINNGFKIAT